MTSELTSCNFNLSLYVLCRPHLVGILISVAVCEQHLMHWYLRLGHLLLSSSCQKLLSLYPEPGETGGEQSENECLCRSIRNSFCRAASAYFPSYLRMSFFGSGPILSINAPFKQPTIRSPLEVLYPGRVIQPEPLCSIFWEQERLDYCGGIINLFNCYFRDGSGMSCISLYMYCFYLFVFIASWYLSVYQSLLSTWAWIPWVISRVSSSPCPSVFDISQVLAGEEADITSSMLSTEDVDTPAEELVYHVEMSTNGMVALKEEPEESILNFTQAHVNKGGVIFIHKGEEALKSTRAGSSKVHIFFNRFTF